MTIQVRVSTRHFQFSRLNKTVGESKRLGVSRSTSIETRTSVPFVQQRFALSNQS